MPEKILGYLVAIGPIAILIYIILKSGPGEKIMKWATKPVVCRKCGGEKFRLPSWWNPEMSNSFLPYGGSENTCGLPSIPPQECANCGELQ